MARSRPVLFPPIRNYDGRVLTVEEEARIHTVTGGNKNPIVSESDNFDQNLFPIRTPTLGKFRHVK